MMNTDSTTQVKPALRSVWTDEASDLLARMWRDGEAPSVIAGELARNGLTVTKNAVIGRAHRMKLGPHAKSPVQRRRAVVKMLRTQGRKRPYVPPAKHGPMPEIVPPPPPRADDVARIAFTNLLPFHCRWPVGEPGKPGFGYCGCARADASPYCADHAARAYPGRAAA